MSGARGGSVRVAAVLLAAAGASAPGIAAQAPPLRTSFDLVVPVPPTPVPVAGTPRLVYELHLTSFAPESLEVRSVEVLDPRDGAVLARVSGDALGRRLGLPGAASDETGSRIIAPGTHGIVYFEIPLDGRPAPVALEHRVAYRPAGADGPPFEVRGARVAVREVPPIVLSPPVRGGPWAAVYDPAWERGHRRVVYAIDGRARIPGRFAIDWFKLDAEGRLARSERDRVADWYGYGAEVLAVADAVVVATRDDVPESPTISGYTRPSLRDATGNYIALDIGDGRYAFYEHLRPGSIRVAPGDRVRRGQVIAAAGFTGSSGGPHLHFHVADANAPLGAEGVPFVLDRFVVLGRYLDFDDFGSAPWAPVGDATGVTGAGGRTGAGGSTSVSAQPALGEIRTRELPAPNVVVHVGDLPEQPANASQQGGD